MRTDLRSPGAVVRATVLLTMLGACAVPPAADPPPVAAPAAPTSPMPAPRPPGDTGPRPPEPAETSPRDCDDDEASRMAETVAAQLDALASGDFAGAYALASPFFRALVDADGFASIIRDRYPELLDVETRRLEGCRVVGRRATLRVAITARSGARRVLGYELSREADGWRIDGAGDLEAPRPARPSPSV